jgi:tRNA-dihydrouridine synthase
VAKVKDRAEVPVMLSGDITSPEDAGKAFDETGCDAVMVGRGALGRPWIFAAIRDYLTTGSYRHSDCSRNIQVVLDHLDLGVAEFGEQTAVVRFRKHLLWYTKGIPGVVALRSAMATVSTRQQVTEVLDQLLPDRSRVTDGHE